MRDDFAVRIDGPGPTGPDLELVGTQRADLVQGAVFAGAEGVSIMTIRHALTNSRLYNLRSLVIDVGILGHDISATIIASIAHGDLQRQGARKLAVADDVSAERPGAGQHAKRRNGIAQFAKTALRLGCQFFRQLGAEAGYWPR